MKAFRIERPRQVGYGEAPEPEPGPADVLLRVQVVGFCGTDLSSFRGSNPLVSYPCIPGHEIAATVEAVGGEVPGDWEIGAPVTVVPYTACGRCAACRNDRRNACRDNRTLGVQREGAFTEWIAVPGSSVVRAPALTVGELALVEPLSVGFHAVDRGAVRPGEVVAVLGCGAVGLGAVAGAAARGAEVVAVDLDASKLDLARRAGAGHTVDATGGTLHRRLQDLTEGEGPGVVIEAVGAAETFLAAVEEVAYTGRVVYIGYARAPVAYETALFVKKELDIRGSRNATPADFNAVVAALASGAVPAAAMISATVPFEEAGTALQDWDTRPRAYTRIHVRVA